MVEWLAGNRIRGTSAEKPALALPSGSVGGWKELGRVNASVGEVTGLADKRYLMVLGHHIQGSGNSGLGLQINGDTTAGHYPRRYSMLPDPVTANVPELVKVCTLYSVG